MTNKYMTEPAPGTEEEVLSALAGVLEQLWLATLEAPEKPCSLAKLSKRSQRQMSVLMRQLSFLVVPGWIVLSDQESGRGSVALTATGRQMCAEMFGAQPPTSDIRTTL
jgi:hypothetical protein